MPPWIIFDDFEEVPDAKSPFSTRAVRRPRLAASSATPTPVMPPPMTSTSNSSSARRRNASARRKGCTEQACHILRAARPGLLSCRRDSRRGAGPSDGAGASRADAHRRASCRGRASGPEPGERRSMSRRRRPPAGRPGGRRCRRRRTASARSLRQRPASRRAFSCAFSPFGVSRTTLPRRAVGSGSVTVQPRRSSHPRHMALASRDTPVSRGSSPTRVPEWSSTRNVLALTGNAMRAVDSTSTVKARRTPLRSGESGLLAADDVDAATRTARGCGASTLPPWVGWMTGR